MNLVNFLQLFIAHLDFLRHIIVHLLTLAQDNQNAATEPLPLTDITDDANKATNANKGEIKARTPRQPKQRGPPEDGIPSTTKVMVANLPYDLSEEKV